MSWWHGCPCSERVSCRFFIPIVLNILHITRRTAQINYLRHRDEKHTVQKLLPGQPILYCDLLASLWQYICIGYPHWIPLLWQQAHSVVPFDRSNQHGHPFWDLVYFLAHWGMRAASTSSFDTHISDSKKILPRTMGNIETHPMFPCYHKIGRYQNLLVMKIFPGIFT